jgi:uncharacterized phage-associated protein
MEALKLQKLVYYVQAWHVTALGRPLFEDRIEAWDHGPVVSTLWNSHRGYRYVSLDQVAADAPASADLSVDSTAILEAVCSFYGRHRGWALRNMSHDDRPWADAYQPNMNCEITPDAMRAFYAEMLAQNQPHPDIGTTSNYEYVTPDEYDRLVAMEEDSEPDPKLVAALKMALAS